MQIHITASLDTVDKDAWNSLRGPDQIPFLRHEFLAGLERHGCVGERWGWLPRHVLLKDGARLLGAVPLYAKFNSYGELVFDWSWAAAYQRAGLAYYPKLVCAVPYTPVSGPRLLTAPDAPAESRALLIQGALSLARELGVSSLHWLFPDADDHEHLLAYTEEDSRFLPRLDCQFQWFNEGYRDFDDFLEQFTSKKRKNIKRERRRVEEAGIELEVLGGADLTDMLWETYYRFYADTFTRRGGHATLSLDFFKSLGRTMPESVVLVLAKYKARYVAGAFSLRGENALYGRHWGCDAQFDSLHFEACYYSGIDYCIQHGLQRFEPGAQGEHKISRGFRPVLTRSAHWLANPRFSEIVARYLVSEREGVEAYRDDMVQRLPFKG